MKKSGGNNFKENCIAAQIAELGSGIQQKKVYIRIKLKYLQEISFMAKSKLLYLSRKSRSYSVFIKSSKEISSRSNRANSLKS